MMINKISIELDSLHDKFDFFGYDFSEEIWTQKYKFHKDNSILDTFHRVALAMASAEVEGIEADWYYNFKKVMSQGLFVPAGRNLAGAGTGNRVTLVNCFVNKTIEDNLDDIMLANKQAALSMQQGGGIGTDFSTVRPSGARLQRTGSPSSGPIPFMRMWDSMCQTIMSAGNRRGAMMATLSDTHPDLIDYIHCKREAGSLVNFNISVLVSEAFLSAIAEDAKWPLYFHEPMYFESREDERPQELKDYDFIDENGVQQYTYSVHDAGDLWNQIIENTYEYSEPGIIFIDEVNAMNNLNYVEDIRCTNPCGEQPLPPYGACNLGAINLAKLVKKPFTPQATFNYDAFKEAINIGVRFLDNVIDVTNYPLEEQKEEQLNKRRIGLGFTGLADAIAQLGFKYGDLASLNFVDTMGEFFANMAYQASAKLAYEKDSFLLYDEEKFLQSKFVQRLSSETKGMIKKYGMRNGVVLTLAPTGTTSIVFGNVSSSCEPNFALEYKRKVRNNDNTWREKTVESFLTRFYKHVNNDPDIKIPEHFVTAQDLGVKEHIDIQAALQKWIDSSISKTVNCPTEMTFEEFKDVYSYAASKGCKGCTTYRPSDVRGSILSIDDDEEKKAISPTSLLRDRPEELYGVTYKLTWPHMSSALYMTVNQDSNGRPFEIFFATKDARYHEWMTGLTLAITSIFRLEYNSAFIAEELSQVVSMSDTAWVNGRHYGSLIAYIGESLQAHFIKLGMLEPDEIQPSISAEKSTSGSGVKGEICPTCRQPTYVNVAGCMTCSSCGYSKCG